MRRSKSNPAKYTRNYRKVSQRKMTQYDGLDEEQEMERLRQVLKDSTEHLEEPPRKRTRPEEPVSSSSIDTATILSEDLLLDTTVTTNAENPLIAPRRCKQQKQTTHSVELTPAELKRAKLLQKTTERKLLQLEKRAAQTVKRTELYAKLQASALPSLHLLNKSSALGKRVTKKERLQQLLQKERAGVELTVQEKNVLYETVETNNHDDSVDHEKTNVAKTDSKDLTRYLKLASLTAHLKNADDDQAADCATTMNQLPEQVLPTPSAHADADQAISSAATIKQQPPKQAVSFAASMMASLAQVKVQSQLDADKLEEQERLAQEQRQDVTKHEPPKRYIPPTPTILKTAATLQLQESTTSTNTTKNHRVVAIERPAAIQVSRYELPVSAMEYEVMDAVRNHDVIIVCGETGSGKSTQIPQFLYEGGLTLPMEGNTTNNHFVIGVTQPRRVAAVSTAKRVCYEMGHGDGQQIKNDKAGRRGNLVAYQTRYETAGLGEDTQVKFMTDGILLQEIQSDLLLRKYSAIILDEAHERNLNTDILIGLLSASLPLRKQAALEPGSGLGPLKVIIMSATLRVEDFTSNGKLFASIQPVVIKIPGRTHPVTIHHSKITELEEYEDEAFRKICKIHRKLPNGGILVFLTGKQEIVRMVNRLRKALSLKTSKRAAFNDVVPNTDNSANDSELPRDMDDEDMDGEFFDSNDTDDYDDSEKDDDIRTETGDSDEVESPLQAHILPLYSLLSADEQMKIFRPPPEGHRLIIISTNVAETSLTIPGISYVVDSGRQKCRNFNAGTGVASYDIMWISKAAANQRAGRAGRTGPGHCYRLYSSSMFARHMDDFELPEVLTRPLEDVVLAMKAMRVSQVANFPFPTPPDQAQLKAALNLLANIGCVDLSKADEREDDGTITRLGAAVSKLPLGVRYGKMLLVGAQACVLDYAIAVVAVLSEASPFLRGGEQRVETTEVDEEINDDDDNHSNKPRSRCHRWEHKGGDVLAAMLAVGAYSYAGRGAGGESEKMAHKKFCDENDLNLTIMNRIHKMRIHLARLSKVRLSDASGVAAKTGGILSSMDPPDKVQESLLRQAIASGLVDNIAMLAPLGSIPGDHPFSLRSAYISCSCTAMEPLFMDQSSVVFSRDARKLPQWICYDSIQRKTYKDGTPIAVMKNITPVDPSWLGNVAAGTKLLRLGDPVSTPLPTYDRDTDTVMCSVSTYLGCMGWEIPPVRVEMFNAVQCTATKQNYHFAPDDSFRWFARFLLEGKILPEFAELQSMLNDSPAVITRATTLKKVVLLVAALSNAGIDCGAALRKHWAEVNDKFLFANLKQWVKNDRADEAKQIWILAVRRSIAGNTECN